MDDGLSRYPNISKWITIEREKSLMPRELEWSSILEYIRTAFPVSDNKNWNFCGRIKHPCLFFFFSLPVRIGAFWKPLYLCSTRRVRCHGTKEKRIQRTQWLICPEWRQDPLFRVTTRQRVAVRTNYRTWHLEKRARKLIEMLRDSARTGSVPG